jgi:multidrug resistance efflux pump
MMSRNLLLLLGAILVAPIAIFAQANGEADHFDIGDATVQFIAEIEVPALSSGQLAIVNARAYQVIDANAIIAELDPTTLKERLHVAEMRRQLLANKLQSNLAEKIADATLREAKYRYESNSNISISSPGTVSKMELNRSQVAYQLAELELQQVNERKEDFGLELSIQTAEVAAVERLIDQLRVANPVDGVVLKVEREAGEWVNAGETVATVARMDRLQIPILISETQLLQRYAKGTSVAVHWDENGTQHSLRGRIDSVDPQFRSKNEYRVFVEVENRRLPEGWLLAPGRRVTVTVYPSSARAANTSPAAARLLRSPYTPNAGTISR